jgi:hypothetical protein
MSAGTKVLGRKGGKVGTPTCHAKCSWRERLWDLPDYRLAPSKWGALQEPASAPWATYLGPYPWGRAIQIPNHTMLYI